MFLHYVILFATIVIKNSQEYEILSNMLDANTPIKIIEADVSLMERKFTVQANKPALQLYYESLCPGCIDLDSTQFKKVVQLLHQFVNLNTYPYGNARTTNHSDGTVEVKCQHGPPECYGNKLHGCALDIIANATEALLFNACMMPLDSDDDSADKCGQQMNIEVKSIKECANGKKGTDLLIYYGEESKKVGFDYVPYVLLNGEEWKGEDLFNDVCAAFKNPPEPCQSSKLTNVSAS